MKSRTSSSKFTLLKKNITRFSPLWGLYTVCLLLGLFLLSEGDTDYWMVCNLASCIPFMALINCGYAMLVALSLFGDLYNARMCNALHALPVKRSSWFSIHLLSGLLFSLVPTMVMAAVAIPFVNLSYVVDAWQIPLLWWLGTNLQYLFFFGLAVFCGMCVGSRVAMAILYGVLNFASMLVYFMVDSLYAPLLLGVVTQTSTFNLFSPAVQLTAQYPVTVERILSDRKILPDGSMKYVYHGKMEILWSEWSYYGIVTAVGIALLLLAWQLYRKRRLECAGDFSATKSMEPVFQVVISLVGASLFQIVSQMFGIGFGAGTLEGYLFAGAGLVLGWFAGRMFIERTTRVFRLKNWLGLAVLGIAVAASLGITYMDPLGIEDYIPAAEDVEKGHITLSYYVDVEMEKQEEIADLQQIHRLALEDKLEGQMKAVNAMPTITQADKAEQKGQERASVFVTLTYELKNGRRLQREYYIWMDEEEGQLARRYASSLEGVFGRSSPTEKIEEIADLMKLAEDVTQIQVENVTVPQQFLTEAEVEKLMNALAADCAAGTMVQHSTFHNQMVIDEKDAQLWAYGLGIHTEDKGFYVSVYQDAENTQAWLESTGVLDTVREQTHGFYGG